MTGRGAYYSYIIGNGLGPVRKKVRLIERTILKQRSEVNVRKGGNPDSRWSE